MSCCVTASIRRGYYIIKFKREHCSP